MAESSDINATTLPRQPGASLSESQVILEKSSIERAEKRARNMLFGNIALLTALTATQGFIDPPYFLRGLLWVALASGVLSSASCGILVHMTDRQLNELDITGNKQSRRRVNIFDEVAFWAFLVSFFFLAAFTAVNLFESLRTDRISIDIIASKNVVAPNETVSLRVDDLKGEEFIWTTSAGRLLDSNERTVTWIAPQGDSNQDEVVEVKVCVRRNHIFFCETDAIIVSNSPQTNDVYFNNSNLGTLLSTSNHRGFNTDSVCHQKHFLASSSNFSQSAETGTISPDPIGTLTTGLPCCSTMIFKLNCDWNC